jgi:hypothetical protein
VCVCEGGGGEHQTLHPENGGSLVLQKVGILLQHYMVLQPRKLNLKVSMCLSFKEKDSGNIYMHTTYVIRERQI